MAIILKRRGIRASWLAAMGLAPEEGYRATIGLRPVTWPHFKDGQSVQLVAKTGPWRYVCKTGDVGVVEKLIQASVPPEKDHSKDLYRVRLQSGKVAYLAFDELKSV